MKIQCINQAFKNIQNKTRKKSNQNFAKLVLQNSVEHANHKLPPQSFEMEWKFQELDYQKSQPVSFKPHSLFYRSSTFQVSPSDTSSRHSREINDDRSAFQVLRIVKMNPSMTTLRSTDRHAPIHDETYHGTGSGFVWYEVIKQWKRLKPIVPRYTRSQAFEYLKTSSSIPEMSMIINDRIRNQNNNQIICYYYSYLFNWVN